MFELTVSLQTSPGPEVYKGVSNPPQGSPPVVQDTGEMSGEEGKAYAERKFVKGKQLLNSVAADLTNKLGGGGCHWDAGKDPSTAKCVPTNGNNPAYVGWAQPVGSPMYTDKPGSAMTGLSPPPPKFETYKGN
jgi:hypothetical protein